MLAQLALPGDRPVQPKVPTRRKTKISKVNWLLKDLGSGAMGGREKEDGTSQECQMARSLARAPFRSTWARVEPCRRFGRIERLDQSGAGQVEAAKTNGDKERADSNSRHPSSSSPQATEAETGQTSLCDQLHKTSEPDEQTHSTQAAAVATTATTLTRTKTNLNLRTVERRWERRYTQTHRNWVLASVIAAFLLSTAYHLFSSSLASFSHSIHTERVCVLWMYLMLNFRSCFSSLLLLLHI